MSITNGVRRRLGGLSRRGRELMWRGAARYGGDPDDATFVELTYRIMLEREPDPGGFRNYLGQLGERQLTRHEMLEQFRGSDEFWFHHALAYDSVVFSIHRSRSLFVRSFPRAERILDLGGTHQSDSAGALVRLGYPYPFERLVIVDLPSDDRHELYQPGGEHEAVQTELGPVEYEYRSMTDLSPFADGSFDLVYSGQSIEHVSESDAEAVIAEVRRVLCPGGWFALDTPNGRLCRLQLADTGLTVTNPDHEVEYDHAHLAAKLEAGGFEISEAKGLVFMGESVEAGAFSMRDLARHPGVFHEIDDCYLLAYLCRRAD
jgi:SAM-dependent methyltransferase